MPDTGWSISGQSSNGDSFIKRFTSLLVIVGMLLGGYIALEHQIEAAVSKETRLREQRDTEIVDELKEIRRELSELNKYLRDHKMSCPETLHTETRSQ
jgi:hypothetical protein